MCKSTGRIGFLVQFYKLILNLIKIEALIKNFFFRGLPPQIKTKIKISNKIFIYKNSQDMIRSNLVLFILGSCIYQNGF